MIADAVTDLKTHLRMLCDPDNYRPHYCPNCGDSRLHVHDYRERLLRGDHEAGRSDVIRFSCAHCGARWQILPAFIARHLWRSWRVVERSTLGPERPGLPRIPEETKRRWRSRLASNARFLVQVFASVIVGGALLSGLLSSLALDSTREEFVLAYACGGRIELGHRLEAPAALLHRLVPGVRVM